jgi:hypothetical protein
MTAENVLRAEKKRRMRWTERDLGLRIPSSGTHAAIDFFISYRQINSFLQFLINMVGRIEHTAKTAHDALVTFFKDHPTEKVKLTKDWESRRSTVEDLQEHRQFLMEVILVRHVENYLNYLSSLLREVFLARPEALRSAEKIELEVVLRHDSIEDLVKTITERKVEALSYSSFADLAEYFLEKFHITLVPHANRQLVIEAIETRNISVHNRCIVNQRFVSRTGGKLEAVGKLRDLVLPEVEETARQLAKSVKAVDLDARKRLHVKGHHFPKHTRIATEKAATQSQAPTLRTP